MVKITIDKVTIYEANSGDFKDLYKGEVKDIPLDILEMNVKIIGASKKGVIDIQVF